MVQNKKENMDFCLDTTQKVMKDVVSKTSNNLLTLFLDKLKEAEIKNLSRYEQLLIYLQQQPKSTSTTTGQEQQGLLPTPSIHSLPSPPPPIVQPTSFLSSVLSLISSPNSATGASSQQATD